MPDIRIQPRRSALYVPGANTRAIEKARTLGADVIIFDLEDAVAPVQKEAARANVAAALKTGGYAAETAVRINSLPTKPGSADLKAVAPAGCDAILLPKVESAKEVRDAALRLAAAGAPASTKLWCMIETPLGVLHAHEIATSSPLVACLVMGTSDLVKDLRARHTHERQPVLTSLGLCILAARAAGIAILDGVHLNLDDDEGFAAACRQGAELGFDGKTLIHPKTIAVANAAFGPTVSEVAWSNKIIEAYAQAVAKGQGVVVVDGQLIEVLHVEDARRTVALADTIAKRSAGTAAHKA
jgi:citrate lyase subunit beta / citryl-CoA lyase